MTEQQEHLKDLIEQHTQLVTEINALNSQLTTKKELNLKVLGAIEYLNNIGITLLDENSLNNQKEEE
jgi:prefoldin subunit 5